MWVAILLLVFAWKAVSFNIYLIMLFEFFSSLFQNDTGSTFRALKILFQIEITLLLNLWSDAINIFLPTEILLGHIHYVHGMISSDVMRGQIIYEFVI